MVIVAMLGGGGRRDPRPSWGWGLAREARRWVPPSVYIYYLGYKKLYKYETYKIQVHFKVKGIKYLFGASQLLCTPNMHFLICAHIFMCSR